MSNQTTPEISACVGIFSGQTRMEPCRSCKHYFRHRDYVDRGAPIPHYVLPSSCPRPRMRQLLAQGKDGSKAARKSQTTTNKTKAMDLKKGRLYLCILDVTTDDGSKAYLKGRVYASERNGCVTDEQGDAGHEWTKGAARIHFAQLKKETKNQEQ